MPLCLRNAAAQVMEFPGLIGSQSLVYRLARHVERSQAFRCRQASCGPSIAAGTSLEQQLAVVGKFHGHEEHFSQPTKSPSFFISCILVDLQHAAALSFTMHSLLSALTALLSLQVAAATPMTSPKTRSPFAVKETHHAPRGWKNVGEPHSGQTLDLRIGLKNKKFAVLEKHLYEISLPTHHRYRQHFSKDEVDTLVRPDEDASTLVDEWLEDNGIEQWQRKYSSAGDWISISLPVERVESLLNTKYQKY